MKDKKIVCKKCGHNFFEYTFTTETIFSAVDSGYNEIIGKDDSTYHDNEKITCCVCKEKADFEISAWE